MPVVPADIHVPAEVLQSIDQARGLEWLETNGLGGYAMGTALGAHTRRYHGLLVAAVKPPVVRQNLLAALDVTVDWIGGRRALTGHFVAGRLHPPANETLARFDLDPFPRWTHRLGEGFQIIHELWMDPGHQTTVMVWRLPAGSEICRLSITPLLALRDHHHLTRRFEGSPATVSGEGDRIVVTPHSEGIHPFALVHTGGNFHPLGEWRHDFHLAVEATREHDWTEDRWAPGTLRCTLDPQRPVILIATTEEGVADAESLAAAALERRLAAQEQASLSVPVNDAAIEAIAPAVRPFHVQRADGRPTIIAGYPWFTDWGRDTMIALPGLCLIHGDVERAIAILRTWMSHIDQGMIPNRFPDHGEAPEFNSVDAALWLAVAAMRVWQCLGGRGPEGLWPKRDLWKSPPIPVLNQLSTPEACFLHEVLDAVEKIIAGYTEGTRHGIRVDDDGLVTQGEPGQQLTWMDAKWEDRVFTPRHGKPIEVQALWFNTLCVSALLWRVHGDLKRAKEREERALAVREAAEASFAIPGQRGLADVIDADGMPDVSIRPNQIFAVSLPFALVEKERAADVLLTVERHLLTPFGLRSLAPSDPKHIGVYRGPREVRDAAYHQGTVWAWLIGPWVDASLRVHGATPANATALRQRLQWFVEHFTLQHGLGSISEIFDSDYPHAPKGCPAQAWSVSELLRALWMLEGVQRVGGP